MALIKCPECHREISDQAESCPHCGYPIQKKLYKTEREKAFDDFYSDMDAKKERPKKKSHKKPIIIVAVLVVVFALSGVGVYFGFNYLEEKKEAEKRQEEQAKEEAKEEEEENYQEELQQTAETEEEQLERKKNSYNAYISAKGSIQDDGYGNYQLVDLTVTNNGDEDLAMLSLNILVYDANKHLLAKETVSPITMGDELKAGSTYRLDNTRAFDIGYIEGKPSSFDITVDDLMFQREYDEMFE